jgi:hypothetical protein
VAGLGSQVGWELGNTGYFIAKISFVIDDSFTASIVSDTCVSSHVLAPHNIFESCTF